MTAMEQHGRPVTIVTGGGRGIGAAVVAHLAQLDTTSSSAIEPIMKRHPGWLPMLKLMGRAVRRSASM